MSERNFSLYVIKIIDEHSILINYGTDDNHEHYRFGRDELAVKIGDHLKVFSTGDAVVDPITKEHLGYLDRTKDVLEITEMFPKFSICQKIERNEIHSSSAKLDVANFFGIKSTMEETSLPLNVNFSQIENTTSHNGETTPISVGDPVFFID